MPNDNGKVIVSLLAGATAGIVAGLLLAPETGEDARNDLRSSARNWWDGLEKKAQEALRKLQGQAAPTSSNPDQATADALLTAMNDAAPEPGDLTTPAGAGNGHSIAGDDYGTAQVQL